jgi:hypothetical protein
MNHQSQSTPEKFLLFFLVFLQVTFYAYLILTHRIPGGWDGFQYFHLQYYFLNDAVYSGEIPQWLPYLTHGTVSTWWASIQNSLLQSALLLLSPWIGEHLQSINFLVIYHLGMFVDELFLLAGVWLLSRKLYDSVFTSFFVTLTVLGSTIWATQTWHNFHFFYAIPMILYFGHCFLDTGKWRYFCFAAHLLILQTFGNMPYVFSVVSLTVFLYFLFYLGIFRWKISAIKLDCRALFTLIFTGAFLAMAFKALTINTESIINYNYGRGTEGESTLSAFLTYGRNFDLKKWGELFLGISPAMDYSLFIGFIPAALALITIFLKRKRESVVIASVGVVLLLISMATLVSVWAYYLWPTMKYYRHLALISPCVKLFVCLWAGFGFEALLKMDARKGGGIFTASLMFLAVLFLGIAAFLYSLSSDAGLAKKILNSLVDPSTYQDDHIQKLSIFVSGLIVYFDEKVLPIQLQLSALFAFLTSGIFFGMVQAPRFKRTLLMALLFVQVVQIYTYKFIETNIKTISLRNEQIAFTDFQQPPFIERRIPKMIFDKPKDQLLRLFKFNPIYWSNNLFFFKDEIGHSFRVDHWLEPLDDYMKVYGGQDIDDPLKPHGLFEYNYLLFPLNHPASGKIAGLTENKLQFFASAHALKDKRKMADLMKNPEYSGDILFVLGAGGDSLREWKDEGSLASNERRSPVYQIQKFGSNQLTVTVDAPEDMFIFYADTWHPGWRATVNGSPAKVYQSNLAYKAVALEAGNNQVKFYFHDLRFSSLYFILGISSLVWIVYLFRFIFRAMSQRVR